MSDLFSNNKQEEKNLPLAEILRPKKISEFIGQEHLLGEESSLHKLIKAQRLFSFILCGKAGCGKTSLAKLIAGEFNANLVELSAVNSGVKELREVINKAEDDLNIFAKRTIIFIDEIHRYNKTQQDALLPFVEKGIIYLIGATTENPSFSLVPALLSRAQIFTLEPLSRKSIEYIIQKSFSYLKKEYGEIIMEEGIYDFLINSADGDARMAIRQAEKSYFLAENKKLSLESIENLTQNKYLKYDADDHYNLASALQKSIRGSDENASIYWLAKLIASGEDPRFITRRLMIMASEDIGLADANALPLAVAANTAIEKIGMPEGRIILAHLVTYLAKAKKSNAAYKAIGVALADIEQGKNYPVPNHLKDAHYKDAKKYGAGVGYIYTHDHPEKAQEFMPKELLGKKYL